MYKTWALAFVLIASFVLFYVLTGTTSNNVSVPMKRSSPPQKNLGGPVVINTWDMIGATNLAYDILAAQNPNPAVHLDALENGMHYCEEYNRCGFSVGEGGSPDEHGETALDASIIDGNTLNAGAVGNLRRVSHAVGVARAIIEYTKHTMLVGDLATEFALEMGFPERDLHTNFTLSEWRKWLSNKCQPNFRKNVIPDPTTSCGPYQPAPKGIRSKLNFKDSDKTRPPVNKYQHDTIGMVTLSASGSIGAGASTNGATWKVPGRLGDVPIIGAAAYADTRFGGCAATGDGDILMKFLPCYLTIENLRNGLPLQEAADRALLRITEFNSGFAGALVALSPSGEFVGSAFGWTAEMAVRNSTMSNATIYKINPITLEENGSYKPSYLTEIKM